MKKLSTEQFIEKAKQVHGDKYDYSKTCYINKRTTVCIICPKHGEFWQRPDDHIKSSVGCPKCSGHYHKNTENFIVDARRVHKDKYDYSKVEYIHSKSKVCIICPIHGEFWQTPNDHLDGCGCPKCKHKRQIFSTEDFIREAKKIHGERYSYEKTKYIDARTKVCITCREHGDFWQLPLNHIGLRQNCPKCTRTLKGQTFLYNCLKEEFPGEEILWEASPEWLGKQRFDVFMPKYNLAIEYNGEQHYKPIGVFGGEENYKYTVECDKRKKDLCKKYGIVLLYIKYDRTYKRIPKFVKNLKNIIENGELRNLAEEENSFE